MKHEARINKKLLHPAIIRVVEYKYIEPEHCLVMEYFKGKDLGKVLQSKKSISVKDTLQIIWQICDALEFAHSKGIIHRDIKPENIIVGTKNRIKITDFGLARALNSSIASVSNIGVGGTPFYIAPEVIDGGSGDEKSDIYSLGATMYHMLSGTPPFKAENEWALLDMHRKQAPNPIQNLQPSIPQALAAIVHKALEKRPSDRFQSATEMRKAIEVIAQQEGVCIEPSEWIVPTKVKLRQVFWEWPVKRIVDLWGDILANSLYAIIAFVLLATFTFVGIQNWPYQLLAKIQATETPTVTLTSTNTPSPTFTISPTFTTTTTTANPPSPTFTLTPRNAATATPTQRPTQTATATRIATPTQTQASTETVPSLNPPGVSCWGDTCGVFDISIVQVCGSSGCIFPPETGDFRIFYELPESYFTDEATWLASVTNISGEDFITDINWTERSVPIANCTSNRTITPGSTIDCSMKGSVVGNRLNLGIVAQDATQIEITVNYGRSSISETQVFRGPHRVKSSG